MTKPRGFRSRPAPSGTLSARPPARPLEQRDALKQEMRAAYQSYTEHTELRKKAERAKAAAQRDLATVEGAIARGKGTEQQREECELRLEEADTDYTRALDRANRGLDTSKALEVELNRLYAQFFDEFAVEANRLSEAADSAITELVEGYRRAQQVWAEAQAAWIPLCHSVRIASMPPFPLTDGDMAAVIRGWRSKPPAIDQLPFNENAAVGEVAMLKGLDVAG
jgi:hypothetical protein